VYLKAMLRLFATVVALAFFLAFVNGQAVLSLRNKDVEGQLDIQKDTDLTFIYQGVDVWYFDSGDSYIPVLNYGAILGPSAFENPGALRYQDNDITAYLNNQWTSLTTSTIPDPALRKRSINPEATCVEKISGRSIMYNGMLQVCSKQGDSFAWKPMVDLSAQFFF